MLYDEFLQTAIRIALHFAFGSVPQGSILERYIFDEYQPTYITPVQDAVYLAYLMPMVLLPKVGTLVIE